MKKVLAVMTAMVVVVLMAFVASAGHILGCPHRPTVWNGTTGNDCASDGDGSADNWHLKAGNDEAHGDIGADLIAGEGGDDVIHGGNGPDDLTGGDGHDNLYEFDPGNGDLSTDDLNGGAGNDFMECGRGTDTCLGGTQTVGGQDTIFHCHDSGADTVGGFEQHIDVNPPNC